MSVEIQIILMTTLENTKDVDPHVQRAVTDTLSNKYLFTPVCENFISTSFL